MKTQIIVKTQSASPFCSNTDAVEKFQDKHADALLYLRSKLDGAIQLCFPQKGQDSSSATQAAVALLHWGLAAHVDNDVTSKAQNTHPVCKQQ